MTDTRDLTEEGWSIPLKNSLSAATHQGEDNSGGSKFPRNGDAALQWALALMGRIPVDEKANMTSIGSIFHHQGGCKPCRFHHHPGKPEGCQYGVGCLFCHFHHERRRRHGGADRATSVKLAALDRLWSGSGAALPQFPFPPNLSSYRRPVDGLSTTVTPPPPLRAWPHPITSTVHMASAPFNGHAPAGGSPSSITTATTAAPPSVNFGPTRMSPASLDTPTGPYRQAMGGIPPPPPPPPTLHPLSGSLARWPPTSCLTSPGQQRLKTEAAPLTRPPAVNPINTGTHSTVLVDHSEALDVSPLRCSSASSSGSLPLLYGSSLSDSAGTPSTIASMHNDTFFDELSSALDAAKHPGCDMPFAFQLPPLTHDVAASPPKNYSDSELVTLLMAPFLSSESQPVGGCRWPSELGETDVATGTVRTVRTGV